MIRILMIDPEGRPEMKTQVYTESPRIFLIFSKNSKIKITHIQENKNNPKTKSTRRWLAQKLLAEEVRI